MRRCACVGAGVCERQKDANMTIIAARVKALGSFAFSENDLIARNIIDRNIVDLFVALQKQSLGKDYAIPYCAGQRRCHSWWLRSHSRAWDRRLLLRPIACGAIDRLESG